MNNSSQEGGVLSCVIFKPESVTNFDLAIEALVELEDRNGDEVKRLTQTLKKAIQMAMRHISASSSSNMLYLEEGLMSYNLFHTIYPSEEFDKLPDIFAKMKNEYLNQVYLAVFFILNCSDSLEYKSGRVYELLQSFKGKMSNKSPDNAFGFRGIMLRKFLEKNKEYNAIERWKETGNFIHIPDSEMDSKRILEHLVGQNRSEVHKTLINNL